MGVLTVGLAREVLRDERIISLLLAVFLTLILALGAAAAETSPDDQPWTIDVVTGPGGGVGS